MNPFKEQQRKQKALDLMSRCKALLDAGKRVDAVKLYRSETRVGLAAAMKALGVK